MLEKLKRDDFASNTNTEFVLEPGTENETVIRLTEVTEELQTPQQRQFSLVFSAPCEMPPEPRIYRIKHPMLGEFDLFLSPFGMKDNEVSLEAIFSTLT